LSYTQTFGYDSLNRLTTEQENSGSSWSQTNAYDRYGNRWIDYGSGNHNLAFSTSTNRITTSGFSYDFAGNLTNDTMHGYTYDAENHFVKVDNVTAYSYDGEGKRVRKFVGENTRFVYGIGGQLIAEFDGSSGALKKEYVYGGGMQATIDSTNGIQYTTSDILGSPRVVTNSSGSVVSRHDYMPFGEELFAGTGGRTSTMGFSGNDGIRKKFTGYERDNETGLDFAQARYFASTQGRFNSPDPVGGHAADPQSWNRYAYVGNNPLTATDPTGMTPRITNHGHFGNGGEFIVDRENEESVYDGDQSWDIWDSYTPAERVSNPNKQKALDTLDKLASQARKDGDDELAAGLLLAKKEIANAVESVGANVAINAILNVGNTDFSDQGTVTIGKVKGHKLTYGPSPDSKCNVFVAGAYADGAGLGFVRQGANGRGYPLADGKVPAANWLGDKNDAKHLTNIPVITNPTLRIGDIVAWRYKGGADAGHSSIYIGGGVVVYAGGLHGGTPQAQTLNYVNHALTGWWPTWWTGPHEPLAVRRYSGK